MEAFRRRLMMKSVAGGGLPVGTTFDFPYTGEVQEVTLPKGTYKLDCWGAQGGYRSSADYGGKGGYSVGVLTLKSKTKLYIYVGGSGKTGGTEGGFNGGGKRASYGGGGGATDIRIGTDSLYARVIVAGGGGSDGASSKTGMYGGGITGGSTTESYGTGGFGGTQTGVSDNSWQTTTQPTGTTSNSDAYAGFGFGGNGVTRSSGYGGAGGGGWYGGSGAYPDGSGDDDRGGGGGSGYVYTLSTASSYPSGCMLNADHYLQNAKTYAGDTEIRSVEGGYETGHSGNGHARITVIGDAEKGKKWVAIGRYYSNSSSYSKIIQAIPTDRKVYAIAMDSIGHALASTQYFTHISLANEPVDVDDYTIYEINSTLSVKRYDTSKVVFDIDCYNKRYRTKTSPSGVYDSYLDIEELWERKPITVQGSDSPLAMNVYYFQDPLYLVQLQESVLIQYCYILIDEKPEPQELELFIE